MVLHSVGMDVHCVYLVMEMYILLERKVKGGLGHVENEIFPPKIIPSLQNIYSIVHGKSHTMCLDYDGNVYTFGSNDSGQLGIPLDSIFSWRRLLNLGVPVEPWNDFTHKPQKITIPPVKQISCTDLLNICVTENSEVYSFGGQYNNRYVLPKKIESLENVDFVECGGDFVVCKTKMNDVYVWGNNYKGQLGIGNRISQQFPYKCINWPDDIVDIKCGKYHTLLLTANQNVYGHGSSSSGQLGKDLLWDEKDENACIDSPQIIEGLFEVVRIECGNFHSMCIDVNNDLFVFGDNHYGQLGLGDTKHRTTPTKHPSLSNVIDISKGGCHTFVKTSNNEIYAFGSNHYLQLGIKTVHENQIRPIRVFKGKEDIWCSNVNIKSKAKSARK